MWLAATRSSMSAGSAAPALAGAVCACAPRAITAWASAAAPAARNVRRVVCDMRSLLRAPGAPRFECAAEIVERGDEGVERGRPGLVAAAHEADLALERRREADGPQHALPRLRRDGEPRGDGEPEARLHQFLDGFRVAELHRGARRHAGAVEPAIDHPAQRGAGLEEDQRVFGQRGRADLVGGPEMAPHAPHALPNAPP